MTSHGKLGILGVMDNPLATLILSGQMRSVSSDLLRVYLVLQADVVTKGTATSVMFRSQHKLVSGLSVHTIALYSNLPELTVKRMLDLLARRGWIKCLSMEAYQLGEIIDYSCKWYFEEVVKLAEAPRRPKPSDVIRGYVDECKERVRAKIAARPTVSPEFKKRVFTKVGLVKEPAPAERLYQIYKECYYEKYHGSAPWADGGDDGKRKAKTYALLRHYIGWCSGDVDEAVLVVKWTFTNWDAIKAAMAFTGGCDLCVLCSKKIFGAVRDWMLKGIPAPRECKVSDGVAHRASVDYDKVKSEGW